VPLGTVAFIGSQVDPTTDTAPVRVAIPSSAGLRPGQFVKVRIVSEERHDRLAVPIESVVNTANGTVIAVVENDHAIHKPVTVGLRDGGLIEVHADGLSEGMTVVAKGAYGLPNKAKVRVSGSAPTPVSYLDSKQVIALPRVRGKGASLSLFEPGRDRLFLAVPGGDPEPAAVRVYQPL
jgi:hypothetical protein